MDALYACQLRTTVASYSSIVDILFLSVDHLSSHITLCLVVSLDKNSSFLPEKSVSAVNLTTVCRYIVSSSLTRVVFYGRLFLAAFRYFSIILLFQAHNLSLHHLHALLNESVSAGRPKDVCMVLHQTDSFSPVHVHTFTSHTASGKVP